MKVYFYLWFVFLLQLKLININASNCDTIRFAFLTDLHVSPGNVNELKLYDIVDEINSQNLDFVVVTGDLSNTGSNDELLAVQKALDNLQIPLYIIPGNHETNWSESAGMKFNEIWGDDHFDFVFKNYNFIGFNTGPYMKMGDGHVKNEDINWLKNRIKQFNTTQNHLFAFSHYPLNDELENWAEVTQILKQGNCKIVFCGHGHKLSLFNFDGIPGIMGRALFMKKDQSFGYQIVELRNDSVIVLPKICNVESTSVSIQFNYDHPDTIQYITTSTRPKSTVNKEFPEVIPFFSYRDSSSIFSGLAIYRKKTLIYGNSEGFIRAVDISTKKLLWERKFEGPIFSNPQIIDERIVVIASSKGKLVGLDAKNGKFVWQNDFKKPILAEGVIENNFIYIGCGDTAFVKIDGRNGKIVWQYLGINGLIQGKPALSEKYVVFGAWDTYLYCLNKESGTLNWKWSNGKKVQLFSPGNIVPAISNDKVIIVAPDRYMTTLDLNKGNELWRTNQFKVRESMGISSDGKTIYAKLMNDSVIAVSASSEQFELAWAVDAGFGYEHSPCPLAQKDNSLVLTTRNGLVIIIDENEKKVRWKHKSGNSAANKIEIDDGGNVWITFMDGKIEGYKLYY